MGRSLALLAQILAELTSHRAALIVPSPGIDSSSSNPAALSEQAEAAAPPPVEVESVGLVPAKSESESFAVHESFSASQSVVGFPSVENHESAVEALPPEDTYLKSGQVAKLLQISYRTLHKLIVHQDNPIPYLRLGDGIPRFLLSEIRRWAEAGGTMGAKRALAKIVVRPPLSPRVGIFGRKFIK